MELNIRAGNGRIAYGNILLFAKTPKQSAIYIDAARRIVGRTYGEGVTKAEIDRIAIPETYDEAVRYAVDLSRDVDFARYDFFSVDGELYGGEITVYPAAGFAPVPQFPDGTGTRRPDSLAQAILENWDIRTSWFMTAPLSGWKTHYRDVLIRNGFGMPPEK